MSDAIYPCANCGTMRAKDQGGTIFTVCDACWDTHWGNDTPPPPERDHAAGMGEVAAELREIAAEITRGWADTAPPLFRRWEERLDGLAARLDPAGREEYGA